MDALSLSGRQGTHDQLYGDVRYDEKSLRPAEGHPLSSVPARRSIPRLRPDHAACTDGMGGCRLPSQVRDDRKVLRLRSAESRERLCRTVEYVAEDESIRA